MLSDFYTGDRKSVTCVDLLNNKGHVCLNSPSESNALWKMLEKVEYDPQPHITETEWIPQFEMEQPYHELELNIGETLYPIPCYRDFSMVCVENCQGQRNHYPIKNPAALMTFYATYIDVFAWHEITAEPFTNADQPYQWMQHVTVNALLDVHSNRYISTSQVSDSSLSPVRAAEFLEILKDIPEDSLSNPETIGEGPIDQITYYLSDEPNIAVSFQDGANNLGVVVRYYEKGKTPHLEIVMVEGSDSVDFMHRKIKTATKWDIQSDALKDYLFDLTEHPSSVMVFVGSEYEWVETPFEVRGGGASISLPVIQGWQVEIVEYTADCESFGIRPAGETEGWIYFSFWPGGYFPEEVNRSYVPYGIGRTEGYISYPIIYDWSYGTGPEAFPWTYRRAPTDIGDYAIINEGADIWLMTYEDAIRDTGTISTMEGGTQKSFTIPEATIIPVDYPQSDKEQHSYKQFSFETPDSATLNINSAWIYEDTIQNQENYIHLGSFWPEYVTEGRVCIEYWEGGFQPGEDVMVEETELYYYGGHYDGFSGTYPGVERPTYLWLDREHGSYVFRFENTETWRNFHMEMAINVIGEELDFPTP